MKKLFQRSGVDLLAALLPLIIMLCIVTAEIIRGSMKNESPTISSDFNYGWVTESGAEISAERLPKGRLVISHSLTGTDISDRDLCFKTSNANVRVLFDDKTAYEYRFVPVTPLFGKSYGMRINMVPIPVGASAVTLELEPLYENGSADLSKITIEESGEFLNALYRKELPGFSLCVLLFLYGASMLVIGLMTKGTSDKKTVDFFSLGAFSMLIGIYSSNETCVLQLITERPEVVRFCAALALMFISYFPVSFVASVTHQRGTVCLPILSAMIILNFVLTVTLSMTGVSDVALMLTFSHICIAIAVFMTFFLMRRAIKNKTNDRGFLHTVVIGMSSAMAGAAVDLVRFIAIKNRILGNSLFTRAGVLIFVLLMGMHLMRVRTRLAVEKERSELMETLAYTDGLTGINNRLAFHKKESEIRNEHINCTVVQLDINDLKKVNDEYGHAEGDRRIIDAVSIITESFSEIGTCYRTGGDEFIVIVQQSDETGVKNALAALEEKAAAYNEKNAPPVPMQIAYGYAKYTACEDMLEAAEQLADKRMYEKKKQMKSNNN
ncbi:MAG: GGDEF domain-containing protein [Ruminococcus sp.]|nr:GGDEF domain-containing protein [Ruminococcus sp.]